MTRRSGSGRTRRQAPGLVLPADLDGSLRLLDEAQLDRLVKAAAEKAQRRGLDLPGHSPEPGQRVERPEPPKPALAKSSVANRAAAVTPGQERLILAAFPGRPQFSHDRAGIPPLAANRPRCYHLGETKPKRDGAIDGRAPQAVRHASGFETARFRSEDGHRRLVAGGHRKITTQHRVSTVMSKVGTRRVAKQAETRLGLRNKAPALARQALTGGSPGTGRRNLVQGDGRAKRWRKRQSPTARLVPSPRAVGLRIES